jgi:glucose/mannose-6-phosphate isomerase
MSDLSREAIERLDPQGMLGDILDQPNQLTDALWRADSAQVPHTDSPGGLTVCGMGGSAIGADLAAAAIGDRALGPIRTVRGYALESWASGDGCVLCSSYSGNTEETLAAWETAGAAGARRIALTTGGKLAELARAEGVPVVSPPAGLQPRAAVAYMTVGSLEMAAACGAGPSLRDEVEAAAKLLAGLAGDWGPDAGEDSLAKSLARSFHGTVPVIYGAGLTAPVARRWKTQVNENAKRHAFWADLPEADHNEICAWNDGAGAERFSAVFIDDADLHPRVRRRIELTAEAASPATAVHTVETLGETPFERLMSAVFLGDLVSLYLAALEGVNPTPVEPIERFKIALA